MINFHNKFKIVALVLALSGFLPQCLGISNLLYAENIESAKHKEKDVKQEEALEVKSPAKRFEQILEEIKAVSEGIKSRGKIIESEKIALQQRKQELLNLDEAIREEFKKTEKFLKDKPISGKFLKRHKDFVKDYEERFRKLLRYIDYFIEGKDVIKKAQGLIKFLEENKPVKPEMEFRPEKLPLRSLPVKDLPIEEGKEGSRRQNRAIKGNFAEPDSGYLKETLEVQFTPEIESLAAELDHNPVKIYEYVRNNFDYEPYYGSLKGAQQTLFEGAGNDFDLASLLIALLRVSGIHARYVRGEVIIPIERAMKWLRCVKERELVGRILATNGIPGVYIQSGGKIVAVMIDHIWVEAYVDYIPSRGAVHKKGDTWISLDPSFKEYTYVQGIDVSQDVIFDEDEYLDTLRMESPLDFYLSQIQEYFEENYPDTTFFAGVNGAVVKREYLGLLPATLPYQVENRETFIEIPDTDRHLVEFIFRNQFGEVTLSYNAKTPEIAGDGIALFFKPATPYDEQLIEEYGGLYNVPAYLLTLKPSLRIGGSEVAEGDDIGFGENCAFSLKFHNPSGFTDYADHHMIAGGWYGITLNLQKIPGDVMTQVSDTLIPILEKMDLSDTLAPVVIEPEWAELCLHEFGLGYFSMLDASEEIFSGFLDIVLTRYISECLTAFNVSVGYLYGMPYKVDQTGVLMDAGKVILNPFSRDGRVVNQRYFQILTGFEGSYWEHNLFELWFRLPSISAIKALEIANVESIPIYMIDSTNVDSILPLLELPIELKEEIEDAVNIGFEVKIPKREIQFIDWLGTGYIIRDPETGAGAYKITGGYAGGGSGEEGPVRNKYISFLLLLISRGATVGLGRVKDLELSYPTAIFARMKLYQMGYFTICYEVKTISDLKRSLRRSFQDLMIYFYIGHTRLRYTINVFFQTGNGTYLSAAELKQIVKEVHSEPFKFVFLLGCHTAEEEVKVEPEPNGYLLKPFDPLCGLGIVGSPPFDPLCYGSWILWSSLSLGRSVQEAIQEVVDELGPGWKDVFYIEGDGSVTLCP